MVLAAPVDGEQPLLPRHSYRVRGHAASHHGHGVQPAEVPLPLLRPVAQPQPPLGLVDTQARLLAPAPAVTIDNQPNLYSILIKNKLY